MIVRLFTILLSFLIITEVDAQCSLTANISANGPVNFCEYGSVDLTAVTNSTAPWTQKSNIAGTAREQAVTFNLNGKAYVGMGSSSAANTDFWEYDPATDVWTQKASFPGLYRSGAFFFEINNKGYLGCGTNGFNSYLPDVWEYDPILDSWTIKDFFPGTHRAFGSAVCNGTKAYVGLGVGVGNTLLNDFWEYDPSNDTWIQKTDFGGSARYNSAAFSIGNNIYVGTGVDNTGYLSDFWAFDVTNNNWTQKADLNDAAASCTAFSLNNNGYIIFGGHTTTNGDKSFAKYSSLADSWSIIDTIPSVARTGALSFIVGNKAYVGGGFGTVTSTYLSDFWEYDFSNLLSYNWSSGQTTPSINVISSGNYVVNITSESGCIASASQSVQVNPVPQVGVGAIPASFNICEGEPITLLVDTNASPGGPFNISWSNGATTSQITVNPAASTNYTMNVSGSNGCILTVNLPVTVNPLPAVGNVIFNNTITVNESGASYQWFQCFTTPPPAMLVPISGETNQSMTVTSSGQYAVIVTTPNGCVDTSACSYVNFVGLREEFKEEGISIYPNPSANEVNIKFLNAGSYIISDALGHVVEKFEIKNEAEEIKLAIVEPGVYFLLGERASKKILITK